MCTRPEVLLLSSIRVEECMPMCFVASLLLFLLWAARGVDYKFCFGCICLAFLLSLKYALLQK